MCQARSGEVWQHYYGDFRMHIVTQDYDLAHGHHRQLGQ